MAHRAVRKAYGERPQLGPTVRHDVFLADRWTGVIDLEWRIEADRPVVIGAGWFGLDKPPAVRRGGPARPGVGPRAQVVAEIARRGSDRVPVLPGSSIKGAVRQVYELLTPSCQPAVRGACRVRPRDAAPEVCPACSLFGAPGLGGRLSFGEAAPFGGGARVKMIGVPTAWAPRRDRPGTVKVYDQREAVEPRSKALQKKSEATWSVSGVFRSRLRLINAGDEELGLLFGALGLGARSPMLRLGGRKYDGLGGVDLELVGARRSYPGAPRLDAAAADAWARGLLARSVFDRPERQRAWDELHAALAAG